MEKSEISEDNQIFMEDIARLSSSEKDVPDLDFRSDQAELIFEKEKLVSKLESTI